MPRENIAELGNERGAWYVARAGTEGAAMFEMPNLAEIALLVTVLAIVALPDLIRRATSPRHAGKGTP
jgi:hypothetical protein